MRVVLTGFMGTGKTAVGLRVAERLGREFVDTDALVERRAGKPVRAVFATDGEKVFRELERAAVEEACAQGDVVVATGGGALIDERNVSRLADGSLMVRLTAAPSAIARRVRATAADRPLLAGAGGLTARIRELLEARAPIYARVPFAVDTTGKTIEAVADEVIAALATAEGPTRAVPRRATAARGAGARRSAPKAALR
jgi:shikimate kinase